MLGRLEGHVSALNRLDATHAPELRSWVDSANTDDTDFPLQNLPYGRFKRLGSDDAVRVGEAISEQVLDLGTGTLSGPGPGQGGSMLELSAAGKQPIQLPGGEQRSFLEDGDTVTLRGTCVADGAQSIGFGECRGTVLPAL